MIGPVKYLQNLDQSYKMGLLIDLSSGIFSGCLDCKFHLHKAKNWDFFLNISFKIKLN